ncbi:MAG: exodeoxyribonuclease V subunit alpha [Ectothiorhodospiraceae bacterium AqS1]|nr:exodeoxyribonuclease V subunit alpha [Ectothiorhodospiraceae bacterium AqS1]
MKAKALAKVKSKTQEPIELGDIDRHFADLIKGIDSGGNIGDAIYLAAALVSYRNREGHVCLDIETEGGGASIVSMPPSPEAESKKPLPTPSPDRWLEALERSRAVMKPDDDEIRPLVLEGSTAAQGRRIARLYLHRMWEAQKAIAQGIGRLIDAGEEKTPPSDPAGIERIDAVFGPPADSLLGRSSAGDEDQRKAAQVALRHRFCVITGGPGTGKTTTVANIIALLVEGGFASCQDIKLAAPTGKAASRLSASVKERCADLAQRIPSLADIDSATTLHRLLLQSRDYFPSKVLIIDECSMVDISLMARTLSILPRDTRLILLGDADQLSSVQPGSVFADLCPNAETPSALSHCVIRLRSNWRFPPDRGIGRFADAIIKGQASEALACLRDPDGEKDESARDGNSKDSRVERQAMADIEAFDRLADECTKNHFAPMIQELAEVDFPCDDEPVDEEAIERIRRRFNAFRALCAHRRGTFGCERFNRRVEGFLRERGLAPYGDTFYLGRPIIVDRNDSHTGLANGDTGIVVRNGKGEKRVWFPDAGGEEKTVLRLVSPQRLPEHSSFFALTVHRSQGSEYDEVAIVLGPSDSPLATRQLLYTAVTRAKQRVVLHAQEEAIRAAVERETVRSSGLPDALRRIDRASSNPGASLRLQDALGSKTNQRGP